MGKIKEQMIEKENDLVETIHQLEENTKELECTDFEEEFEPSKVKEVISEVIKLVKEIKEVILI